MPTRTVPTPPTARPTTASCPACGAEGAAGHVVFEARGVPVHVGHLYPTAAAARAAPRGDIRLAGCPRCGYVWNAAFEPERLDYRPGYNTYLHHSATYQAFLRDVADGLVARHGLRGAPVVDVGAGDGAFLRVLAEAGGTDGVGYDPASPETPREPVGAGSVRLVRGLYPDDAAAEAAVPALVACRQALHMFIDPGAFLRALRREVAGRDVAVYLEVPNAAYVIRERKVWNVFYEHLAYLTPSALVALVERSGFRVTRAAPCYADGQYLAVEARPAPEGTAPETPPADGWARDLRAFADAYRETVQDWRRRVLALHAAGRRVVVWGAAGRGVTFLNTVSRPGLVACAVDVNPGRHGGHLPGTGERVLPPRALLEVRPDVVILTNRTYEAEIRAELAAMGLTPEVWVA